MWCSNKAFEFDNIVSIDDGMSLYHLAGQELKYDLFKFLPFPLKRFSKADKLNFAGTMDRNSRDAFEWYNVPFYNNHQDHQADITDEKLFHYIHLEGGHVPFDVDANMNPLEDKSGTYPDKLIVTMKTFAAYIKYLKDNNAYDNATIVFMADHGYGYDGTDRQNPILYIKGPNEEHDQMLVSDKQVSYEDLCQAFTELIDGRSSTEIFSELPTDGRVRRYINNHYSAEEHMDEYEQTGKAWDVTTLKLTGRSFDLK